MSKIIVQRYAPERKQEWDAFVAQSKNGVFFFQRNYLAYHEDRFPDASLMFYNGDSRLVALLPATLQDGTLSSHAGLTFGGVVSDATMKAGMMLDVFESLRSHLTENHVKRLVYTAVPHIYHRIPSEEDLYALYRFDAKLIRRDLSSAILLRDKLMPSKGRRWSLQRAQKHGLEVKQTNDFAAFMSIEEQLLEEKHKRRPVHTTREIETLAERFPNNIKLFGAYAEGEMLAGVIIYENTYVAHSQYIGANSEGKNKGALDVIMAHLINDYYRDKIYFDFGISTEEDGRFLNSGLIENKQAYGARGIVHDFYQIDLD